MWMPSLQTYGELTGSFVGRLTLATARLCLVSVFYSPFEGSGGGAGQAERFRLQRHGCYLCCPAPGLARFSPAAAGSEHASARGEIDQIRQVGAADSAAARCRGHSWLGLAPTDREQQDRARAGAPISSGQVRRRGLQTD